MLDDQDPPLIPRRLEEWVETLPSSAAEVVSRSDLNRPYLYTESLAVPAEVRAVRTQVTGWIRQLGVSETDGLDIVMAADEAVSNAVEHAYLDAPGTLTLFAACLQEADAVRIVVADHGVWRPPPADRGLRGRGMAMMERLAQVYRLLHGPRGTTVILGWSLSG